MAITTTTSLSRAFTLSVRGSGVASVNTDYSWAPSTLIPKGFALVCNQNNWNVESTWKRLNGERDWLKATTNEAYVYFNSADRHWWIDEPGGLGVFVVPDNPTSPNELPPTTGWKALSTSYEPLPQIKLPVDSKESWHGENCNSVQNKLKRKHKIISFLSLVRFSESKKFQPTSFASIIC